MDKLWFKARRVLSVLLAFAMLASITPVQAFAEDTVPAETPVTDTALGTDEPSGTEASDQTPTDTENSVERTESEEETPAAPALDSDTADATVPEVTPTPAEEPAAAPTAASAETEAPTQTPQPVPEETPAAENEAEPSEAPAANNAAALVQESDTAKTNDQPLTATVDGMTVTVAADLPAGAQVVVTKMGGDDLDDDNLEALAEAVNSNDIREIEAYDITLADAQGNVYTLPQGQSATVTLSGVSLQAAEGQTLYAAHLKADGSADMGIIDGNTVTFTVDSFSPFVVATVGSAETVSDDDSSQEEPTAAPEESDEVDGAAAYSLLADTYAGNVNYFTNTTSDPHVHIYYSVDGKSIQEIFPDETIELPEITRITAKQGIVGIEFYIAVDTGYEYGATTFTGHQDGKVYDIDNSSVASLSASFGALWDYKKYEVQFDTAISQAKDKGAQYAFYYQDKGLSGGSVGTRTFAVSTNRDAQFAIVTYHNTQNGQTKQFYRELNVPAAAWSGSSTDMDWTNGENNTRLVGWSTTDGGSKEYDLSQNITLTQDLDLYTVWEKTTVTVTYNANGGSWTGPETETADKGEDYTVNPQTPTRYGYQFLGWQINGEGTLYEQGETIPAELMQGDVTLKASWLNVQKYSVAVTLSTDSGTALKNDIANDISWDTLNNYKTMAPYELANALLGTHFTADSGVTAEWTPAALSESTLRYTVALTIADDSEDLVKVHYDAGDAAGTAPADVTLVKGDSCMVASAGGLSKTGHTFGGWAYGDTIYNVDDTDTQNNTIAAVQQNMTLTAQWNPIQYTVTWKNQDGTETLATTQVAYGQKPVYEGAAPTKDSTDGEEFSFVGWSKYNNQTEGTAAEELEAVTGDVTYYAAFSAQVRQYPYTINRVYRDTENHSVTVKQSDGTADYGRRLSELVGEPADSVQYGDTYYVYSSNDAAEKTIVTGDNVINLYYDVDSLVDTSLDPDNNPDNGDGIADKYQMTVTYQVVGGSWNDGSNLDKTEVVTLMENGVHSENGTASLDKVPTVGGKPDTNMYGDDSCWSGGATPTEADRTRNRFVYTYQAKQPVTITFENDSLTYNGETRTGKDTFTSTLNSDLYTVTVEGYQAPQGKDVKDGGYQGDADDAKVTITEKNTGKDVTYQYAVSCAAGTLTITPKPVTVSLVADDKTYDGTTEVKGYTLAVDGAVEGETLTAAAKQVAFDSADAGDRTVTATGITLSDSKNYSLDKTTARATATIAPKVLDVTVSFQDRVYEEGNTTVQVAGASIGEGQVIEGDDVTVTAIGTGTIPNDSVQDGAVVTGNVQLTLSGASAGNYKLGNVSYETVNILGVVTYDTNAGGDTVQWTEPEQQKYNRNATVTPTTEKPVRYGYTFLGWSVNEDADKADTSFTMGSTGLKLYAVWQAQDVTVNVTYHYGTEEPVSDTISNKKFDETLTIGTGSYDLPLSAKKEYRGAAYTLASVDMGKENLFTLSADNYRNPTFTYKAVLDEQTLTEQLTLTVDVYYVADNGGDGIPDQYQVTVHYAVAKGSWNDGGDTVQSETVTLLNDGGQWDKNGSAKLSDIPAAGEAADAGYTAGSWDSDPYTATINGGDEGKTFTYTYAVDEARQYTVTYTAQANGTVSPASEKAQVLGTADLQGSAATPADGYVFDGWYMGDSKISPDAVLSAETVAAHLNKTSNAHGETVYGDTEFSARFTIRTDLSYTVRYLEDGTGNVLAGEKTVGGQTFGTTVTETAPDIAGYTVTSDKNPQSLTIGTGENVITFYYKAVGETVAATTAPTASPTPVTAPAATAPTGPAAPAATTAPAATAAPEDVTEQPEEDIQDEETPLAPETGEDESIADEATPLAGSNASGWALLNLILAVLTALGGVLLALGYLLRRKSNAWHLAALIPAIGAVAAFLLTEDMSLKMAFVDKWTLLMVIIAVIQIVVAILGSKNKQDPDEEDETRA